MVIPELLAIVDRIATNTHTNVDIQALREALGGAVATGARSVAVQGDANGATITTGNGNIILNITFQADGVQIDDRRYQGAGAEALRAIIQEILCPTLEIDWQQVSRSFLDEQLRLTTNLLTAGEGISYRTEQVYVPLGLVERKRQTRRGEDVSPEQGSLLYEEIEITQRFENEQFLEQVLQQGHSPNSRGKRIAIIGEPGAGKTTLLQQIAQWVSGHVEEAIAIWVSLADLRAQELEPYLLERWLQATVHRLGQAEASDQVKDAFAAQFQQGRVWLLLDGVDEMQMPSGNPLSEIERQVRMGGLLSQARIVLSCRLNLWDGNRHALLDTFDTYRTLEFSYPQQVEQFIGQWFRALQEAQEGQAERLCTALKAPGKERIQDLVKNPLRLTLLCFDWYLREGTLPETKAGLYEQFVADFYEWKREEFPTTAKQRRQLNAALGELAREAINKEATRFWLRHDFVCKHLGELDELNSLFQLSCQLGWLNKVGVDAENPRKAVYAFFHPTFQEYFAALAIIDWRFFFKHISENPNDPDASYRIFEKEWKEVVLLWLGRDEILEIEKSAFIDALISFDDKCQYFYSYQAYLLAGCCLAEYKQYKKADEVIKELADNSFGIYDEREKRWKNCSQFIKEVSKNALLESDRCRVIKALEKRLESFSEGWFRQRVALALGIIDPNNQQAINTLAQLLDNPGLLTWDVAKDLFRISTKHEKATNALLSQMHSQHSDRVRQKAAQTLGELNPGNERCIEVLLEILQNSQDDYMRWEAARALGKIAVGETEAIACLISLINEIINEQVRRAAALALSQIGFNNVGATTTLNLLLNSPDILTRCLVAENLVTSEVYRGQSACALQQLIEQPIESIRCRAAACLGKAQISREKATNVLGEIIQTTEDGNIYMMAVQGLVDVDPENQDLLEILVNIMKDEEDWVAQHEALGTLSKVIEYGNPEDVVRKLKHLNSRVVLEVLWLCTQKISYPRFYKVWFE